MGRNTYFLSVCASEHEYAFSLAFYSELLVKYWKSTVTSLRKQCIEMHDRHTLPENAILNCFLLSPLTPHSYYTWK